MRERERQGLKGHARTAAADAVAARNSTCAHRLHLPRPPSALPRLTCGQYSLVRQRAVGRRQTKRACMAMS